MLKEYAKIKEKLIVELWLPSAVEVANILYPRNNIKKLKMLTLTHSSSCFEAAELVKNKLTKKEFIFGWAKGTLEKIRLDLEKIGSVIGPYNFEDSIINNCDFIKTKFPFDLLNLDFVSQDPELEDGRIEKEIFSLEHSIKLQADNKTNKFVLLYTSLINSAILDLTKIKNNSDTLVVSLFGNIDLNGMPSNTNNQNMKIDCLKKIIVQICSKYEFNISGEPNTIKVNLTDKLKQIISMAFRLERK